MQSLDYVMVSGSTTMSQPVFQHYYVPLLDQVIAKGGHIRVGCAAGCDTFVQQYCAEKQHCVVTVFVPSEVSRDSTYIHPLCKDQVVVVEGGFKKRDRAMRSRCSHFVGFVSQYGGAASGTAANALAIAARNGAFGCPEALVCDLDGYEIVEFLRKITLPFSAAAAADASNAEAAQFVRNQN